MAQILITIPDEVMEKKSFTNYFGGWGVLMEKRFFEEGHVLPKEHGRLIDADKLDLSLRCMYKSDDNIEGIGYTDEEMVLYNEAIGDVRNVVRNKPTVIESEEE